MPVLMALVKTWLLRAHKLLPLTSPIHSSSSHKDSHNRDATHHAIRLGDVFSSTLLSPAEKRRRQHPYLHPLPSCGFGATLFQGGISINPRCCSCCLRGRCRFCWSPAFLAHGNVHHHATFVPGGSCSVLRTAQASNLCRPGDSLKLAEIMTACLPCCDLRVSGSNSSRCTRSHPLTTQAAARFTRSHTDKTLLASLGHLLPWRQESGHRRAIPPP